MFHFCGHYHLHIYNTKTLLSYNKLFLCFVVRHSHTSTRTPNSVSLYLSSSVTRFCHFYKFLGAIFLTKVAQLFCDLLGYLDKHQFLSKNFVAPYWAIIGQISATFYSNIWSHCPQEPRRSIITFSCSFLWLSHSPSLFHTIIHLHPS